jgi:DNA invertase Pin-like site-specific DNA recombinase
MGVETIWKDLKGQIYLGDEEFVEQMQGKLGERKEDVNIPQAQQRPLAPSLEEIRRRYSNRDRAIRVAYETGGYSYQQIAEYFGTHFTTVGRIVRESRKGKKHRYGKGSDLAEMRRE